jgi:hypothetical protein
LLALEWDVVGAEVYAEAGFVLDGGLILLVEVIEGIRCKVSLECPVLPGI